jgi:hypothetical protein
MRSTIGLLTASLLLAPAVLAPAPDHAATLARLRARLDTGMNECGDKGLATEPALHDPRTDE